jgi:hypothetical protein
MELSWAEAAIYWDCLETTSDFANAEQWIHVAVDSCQDRVSIESFIVDVYTFLLKLLTTF